MTTLWFLLAACLVLAWLMDCRNRQLQCRGSKRREQLFFWLLTAVLGFFCGLRVWGNDTFTYIEIYEVLTPTLDQISDANRPSFASGIGFFYLSCALKTLGVSTQNFLLFFAFVTILPYVWFVRKYSRSMVFGVFLMFTTGFYTFTLAAIKQCVATGLCLIAVSFALDRKWLRYLLFVLLAMLFHPYSMVYFLVPLLMFKPWTRRTFLYVAVFIAIGFYLDSLLGSILDITDMMGADYSDDSFTGEGVNIFRVLVSFVPMFLAVAYGKALFRDSTRENDLMFNLSMVNSLIMFVGLFGTANYFARLANYFLPGQIMTLPWILRKAHPRDKAWLVPCCIAGYLGYFIYENAIIRPFDSLYSHMNFWDYIFSWF